MRDLTGVAHGPQVAIMLSFMPDDALGAAFYSNVRGRDEAPIYEEGKCISMIDGGTLETHELGHGRGYMFERQNDTLKHVQVTFAAKPDANKWLSHMQLNGLSMIHEPGYEMVLAALCQICETPPPPAGQVDWIEPEDDGL